MNINLSFLDVTRIHITDVEPELAQVRVKQNADNRMMPHDEDFLVQEHCFLLASSLHSCDMRVQRYFQHALSNVSLSTVWFPMLDEKVYSLSKPGVRFFLVEDVWDIGFQVVRDLLQEVVFYHQEGSIQNCTVQNFLPELVIMHGTDFAFNFINNVQQLT